MKKSMRVGLLASASSLVAFSYAEAQQLDQIVVTAQKREQSSLDVPVAVTAYNEEALRAQNIQEVEDLKFASPSVTINVQQSRTQNAPIQIRGIGTVGTNAAFEGAVGLYIDGVYRSRPGMALLTFNDIGGLEILRGPQGTLFGKNTTAGAITLTSNRPEFDDSFGAEATFGNFAKRRINGHLNFAVSDTVAFRFSGVFDSYDGFTENPLTNSTQNEGEIYSLKAQLLWEPTENFSAHLIADLTKLEEICCYGFSDRRNTPDLSLPVNQFEQALAAANGLPYYDSNVPFDRIVHVNRTGDFKTEDRGVNLKLDYAFNDNLSLRSITSYRRFIDMQASPDNDFGPLDLLGFPFNDFNFETFTQEFNLIGDTEIAGRNVEFLIGGYYLNENLDSRISAFTGEDFANVFTYNFAIATGLDPNLWGLFVDDNAGFVNQSLGRPGAIFGDTIWDHDNEAFAGFLHTTIDLSDSFKITGGVRYSDETKSFVREAQLPTAGSDLDRILYYADNALFFAILGASQPGQDLSTSINEGQSTYNIALQYFPRADTQIYVSFARGWKSGGLSLNSDAGGGAVCLVPAAGGLRADCVSSGIPGLEAFGFTPFDEDALSYDPEFVKSYEGGIKTTYLDGRGRMALTGFYSDYEDIQFNVFNGLQFLTSNAAGAETAGVEFENEFAVTDDLIVVAQATWMPLRKFDDTPVPDSPNLQDRELPFAPQFRTTVAARYSTQLSESVRGYFNPNLSYTGSHFLDNSGDGREDGFVLVGARAGIEINETIDLSVFCDNCFDEDFLTNQFVQPFYPSGGLAQMVNVGPPRTYGVTIRASF